jgi:uncharacterized membrane protein
LVTLHAAAFLVMLGVFTIVALQVQFPTRAIDIYKWLPPVFALYLGGYHLFYIWRSRRQKKRKNR